jgi:integrase
MNEVILSRNVIVISAEKMKSKKPSVKKMTKLARATIEAAISKRTGSTNFIFVDDKGEPYSENRVSVAFGRACKAAKIKDLRFHDLKHDFATLLAESDVESFKRQHLLDHSDPRMSGKYTHWSPSMLNAIVAIEGKGIGTILSQEGNTEEGQPT